MDASQDFSSFQERISSVLVDTTRVVGQLSSQDLSFYRSLDPTVSATIDKQNARLLNLAECLLKTAVSGIEVEAPDVREVDELDNNWNGIVEVVDSLLERADICLDEYTGVIKKSSAAEEEAAVSRPPPPKRNTHNVLRTRNDLPKPQLLFKRKPLNDANDPFKPLLTTKPHAVLPLAQSLGTVLDENGTERSKHPYETEILQLQYPLSVYIKSTPVLYHPFETTTATWVDTPEAVATMLLELKASKEIAVDLEHHDARSYVGLVSLMQISTRGKDWIIDTLKPWREDLQVLNEVFADPGIVKVFHGAYMDIVWLQRDLGLYVVGLFDTYHAASALGYPGQSLAFLLKKFVSFSADKQYQRADWRIRPLTEEMFKYARSDTHFLLYVYDNLRNELIDKSNPTTPYQNRIENVLARSKETALQIYEPDVYDEVSGANATGWSNMLQRTPTNFTNEQLSVFKAVHQWRDKTARQADESLNFVMPKQFLFSIPRAMPVDVQSLLGLSRDTPSLIKVRASELVRVIKQARENAGESPPTLSRGFVSKGKVALSSLGATTLHKGPREHDQTRSFGNAWASGKTAKVDVFLDQPADRAIRAKTGVSRFWGAIFGSSLWNPTERVNPINEGIRLAVPLPQLTAEIFEGEVTMEQDLPIADREVRAEHQYVKKRKAAELSEENTFVIKQLDEGRKRKLEETEKVPTASAPEAGHGPPEADEGTGADCDMDGAEAEVRAQERRDVKKERRRLRKEEKRRRKAEQLGQSGETVHNSKEVGGGPAVSVDENEQEPFDYAAAPSVLHGKAGTPDRSGSRKAFNPYAKSGDTSKGMHKSRKEVPGKSMTFKR
ncbi:MAG: exosome nuclease subunit [Geoglossum umbratile]|nr:MAG: exosome nuclease subunit [Geoglossum umbratile]